jgi:hypothetical protein
MRARTAAFAVPVCFALVLAICPSARSDEPAQEDAAAIEALQAQGVNLTEPQLVEFMFSFSGAQQARRVGKTLAQEGFRSNLERAGGEGVLLLARKHMLVDERAFAELRARFEAMAKAGHGQYEGWGIP